MQKYVIFVKKNLKTKIWKIKKILKLEITALYRGHRSAAHSIFSLKYSLPKKSPIPVQNGSNYDCHFTIKELVEEFKNRFTCFRENTKQYITFTVLLEEKVTRNDKNG